MWRPLKTQINHRQNDETGLVRLRVPQPNSCTQPACSASACSPQLEEILHVHR